MCFQIKATLKAVSAWSDANKEGPKKKQPTIDENPDDIQFSIDDKFSIMFPIIFTVFNLSYWAVLLLHR